MLILGLAVAKPSDETIENQVRKILTVNKNNLKDLKPIFTDAGWAAYTDALNKTNNLNTIETNQLNLIVNFLGVISVVKNAPFEEVISRALVTYHNDHVYETNDYQINIQFKEANDGYKVNSFRVKAIHPTEMGRMQPPCLLKEL